MRRNGRRRAESGVDPAGVLLDVRVGDVAADVGAKAARLRWLADNDARIPVTFVLPASAGLRDGSGPSDPELLESLQAVVRPGTSYAVRSSATLEDGTQRSMAGQFVTVLDVGTLEDVAEAVHAVLASIGGVPDGGEMGVIIQEMVRPVLSGVSFSRNPMTGLSDVVVEAIEGRGDLLLQDGIDPLRWVDRWGALVERPSGSNFDPIVEEVVAETRRLADAFGSPIDLEWVWDGSDVWWVQARPITGLADLPIYSRRIAKEVLPGMIKPLVWSINVPLVNRAWVRLFTELIGPNDLDPHDLARSIGYRAYFDMRPIGDIFEMLGMPRDSLEGLLGLPGVEGPSFRPSPAVIRKLPRMIRALAGKARYGAQVRNELRELDGRFRELGAMDPTSLADDRLIETIDRIISLGTEAAYHNIVTPLFANAFRGLLTRRLAARDLDIHEVDVAGAEEDGSPTLDLARLAAVLRELPESTIEQSGPEEWPDPAVTELRRFIERHGHLSENANDLSVPRWREDLRLVVGLARTYEAPRSRAVPWDRAVERVPTLARLSLERLRRLAVRYEHLRNQVGSVYTWGYGSLRPLLIEVGDRLVRRGTLRAVEDVYYLTYDELVAAFLRRTGDPSTLVEERRADMEAYVDVAVPEIVYGDDWLPVPEHPGLHLRGIGTSRGQYRGKAVAVRTLADGERLAAGDVLVVPHSDVAWTPLFSRAGAVVAESGGMLAHSSIVAREAGIPAVASVADACRLLDGRQVLVDGYTGDVYIEEDAVA